NLSSSLPNGYRLTVDFGAGEKSMGRHNNTTYTRTDSASQVGNRRYTVNLHDNNNRIVATKKGTYIVDPKVIGQKPKVPKIDIPPKADVISVSPSSITANKEFTVDLKITGQDLVKVVVTWGDGINNIVNLNNQNIRLKHTYLRAGSFPVKLTSHDINGKKTVLISAKIQVKAGVKPPQREGESAFKVIDTSISSPTGKYNQGEKFTFIAELNDILPKGYKVTFKFADTNLDSIEMACSNTRKCQYSNVMNGTGEDRPFEIKILDDKNKRIDAVEDIYSVQGVLLPEVSIENISKSISQLSNGIRNYKAGQDKIELKLVPKGNIKYVEVIWQLRGSVNDDEFEKLKVRYNIDENNSPIIVSRTYPIEQINNYFSEKDGFSGVYLTLKITAYGSDDIASNVHNYKINVYNFEQWNNRKKYLEENSENETNITEKIDPVETKELLRSCIPVYTEKNNELYIPCIKVAEGMFYKAKTEVSFGNKIELKLLEGYPKKISTDEVGNIDQKCLSIFDSQNNTIEAGCIAAVLDKDEVKNYKINAEYDSVKNTLLVINLEEDDENKVSLGTKYFIFNNKVLPVLEKRIRYLNTENMKDIDKNKLIRDVITRAMDVETTVKYIKILKAKNVPKNIIKDLLIDYSKIGLGLLGEKSNDTINHIINEIVVFELDTIYAFKTGDIDTVVKNTIDKTWKIGSDFWTVSTLNARLEKINELRIAQEVLNIFYKKFNGDFKKMVDNYRFQPKNGWSKIVERTASKMKCSNRECKNGILSEDYETKDAVKYIKYYVDIIDKLYQIELKIKFKVSGKIINNTQMWHDIFSKARVGDILLFGHDKNCITTTCGSGAFGISYGYYSHAALITVINSNSKQIVIFHAAGFAKNNKDEIRKEVIDNQWLEKYYKKGIARLFKANVSDEVAKEVAKKSVPEFNEYEYSDILHSEKATYCSKLIFDSYYKFAKFSIADQDKIEGGTALENLLFLPDELSKSKYITEKAVWWDNRVNWLTVKFSRSQAPSLGMPIFSLLSQHDKVCWPEGKRTIWERCASYRRHTL
ncbi:MAG: hypothetical protein KAG14_02730, partial [Mycoplasmataceae bacterium]|nr:hypothetical protein [Mycoplasmataceae bacterium]